KVYVEGALRTRQWEQDGVKRYSTEIVASQMQMLDSRQGNAQGGGQDTGGYVPQQGGQAPQQNFNQQAPQARPQQSQSYQQQPPPNQQQPQQQPQQQAGGFDDGFDDDIPF
ncbi:MAG: single-strand DNA-binding protein, partial [Parasphingorhabdus sp.]